MKMTCKPPQMTTTKVNPEKWPDVVNILFMNMHIQCFYLVEATVENPFHSLLIKHSSLDFSSGVLVVECDCFAGS